MELLATKNKKVYFWNEYSHNEIFIFFAIWKWNINIFAKLSWNGIWEFQISDVRVGSLYSILKDFWLQKKSTLLKFCCSILYIFLQDGRTERTEPLLSPGFRLQETQISEWISWSSRVTWERKESPSRDPHDPVSFHISIYLLIHLFQVWDAV